MPTPRPLRRFLGVTIIVLVAALPAAASMMAVSASTGPMQSAATGGDRDVTAGLVPGARPRGSNDSGIAWSDVTSRYWARTAIDYVGGTNDWMRDFKADDTGAYPFRPGALESRALFARATVAAFAPGAAPDATIEFTDLPADDRFFGPASVAVSRGWMRAGAGAFRPSDPVTTTEVHRALVLALGLADEAAGLDALHTRNDIAFDPPPDFGTTLLGMRLGLRYNHGDESLDVGPSTVLPRAEVAWSLYRAATAPSWTISGLGPYAKIRLPILGPKKRAIVQFGIQYVGYPYVYAGEWDTASPAGYCCGFQPVGGFDCSGLTWWLMKQASGSWDNQPPRPYRGWALAERSSRDMAKGGDPIPFDEIRVGDLLFYDGDSDGTVDHVNVYIGAGWALDSSSSLGGASILKVDAGWYFDHFVHARRIIPERTPPAS